MLEESRFNALETELTAWLNNGEAIRLQTIARRLSHMATDLVESIEAAENRLRNQLAAQKSWFGAASAELTHLRDAVAKVKDLLDSAQANLTALIRHTPNKLENEVKVALDRLLETELTDMSTFRSDAKAFRTTGGLARILRGQH